MNEIYSYVDGRGKVVSPPEKGWKILPIRGFYRVYIEFSDGSTIFDRRYKALKPAIDRADWLNSNTFLGG